METNSANHTPNNVAPQPKHRISIVRILVLLVPSLALLVTIFILWILRPHEHPISPRVACITHLKLIEGAKATWALEHKKLPTQVPTDPDLFGTNCYIFVKPQCPKGGTYTLGAVNEKPTCSVPGHAIPDGYEERASTSVKH